MQRRTLLSLLASSPLWTSRSLYAAQPADIPGTPSSNQYPHAAASLRKLIADEQFVGAVMMISRKGQPEYVDTVGWLDGAYTIPMPRNAMFWLASLSKPITAVAGVTLLEQGKVKLDDPVEKWLPELANRKVLKKPDGPIDDTYPSPRSITVGDLLAFRCGYGGDGPRGPFGAAQRTMADTSPAKVPFINGDDFLKSLSGLPLQYAPGEQWLYDVPADILTVLIERVSGQRYSAYLKQHIFDPLGIKDTGFYVPPDKANRLAQLPGPNAKPTALLADPHFESGAHGMVSTADDYLKITKMLVNKGELNGVRIIKAANVDAMRIDRLSPAEHQAGGFIERYPGRGFGWCGAVRTEALPIGPSVGSYNWAGASGVWMMADFARDLAITIMVQHPMGGPPPSADQPTARDGAPPPPPPQAAPPGKKYLSQTAWNDLIQTEIYKDVS